MKQEGLLDSFSAIKYTRCRICESVLSSRVRLDKYFLCVTLINDQQVGIRINSAYRDDAAQVKGIGE